MKASASPGKLSPEKLLCLRAAHRVWAVASIHGEARRLMRLHDQLFTRLQPGDRLIYLGNYLGIGDAVGETVDELIDFRRRFLSRRGVFSCDIGFLRGAQEEMWQKLLQLQFAPEPPALLKWMVQAGIESTVRAYGGDMRQGFAASRDGPKTITRWTSALRARMNAAPGHIPFFAQLRHAAYTDSRRMLFVHASLDPARPLSEQRDTYWWGREDILQMTAPVEGFGRIVRGFDRDRRGLVETEFAVSIDAGAGRGGRLLAVCFDREAAVAETVEA